MTWSCGGPVEQPRATRRHDTDTALFLGGEAGGETRKHVAYNFTNAEGQLEFEMLKMFQRTLVIVSCFGWCALWKNTGREAVLLVCRSASLTCVAFSFPLIPSQGSRIPDGGILVSS